MNKRMMLVLTGVLVLISFATTTFAALTPKQDLGKLLYFDTYLSLNGNQACASCHFAPGFADQGKVVSEGSVAGLFGGRNAPSSAYAAFSPFFHWDGIAGLFVGGQFWDGRENTLTGQAQGPFLNPVEMAMPSKASVLEALMTHPTLGANPNAAMYQAGFTAVFGVDLAAVMTDLTNTVAVDAVYEMLADAIAAFEKSYELNQFTSKFDAWLAGAYVMTKQEEKGMKLFNGKAKCNLCHLSAVSLAPDGVTPMPPLFTDFTYDNLGIPVNPLLPAAVVDYGLGARLDIAAYDPLTMPDGTVVSSSNAGKFKVMTLRNIEFTAPYGHNGYFATLPEIVQFYNSATAMNLTPEVALNVNRAELGDLRLTNAQINDIVAFLLTLNDGFLPAPVAPAFAYPPFP
jgi:cytochrome c peroxidase